MEIMIRVKVNDEILGIKNQMIIFEIIKVVMIGRIKSITATTIYYH